MGREYISSTLRFKILTRDNFTCQYCGEKAPDVTLEIDHIRPVCLGGDNRESNLVTSCHSCNNAKGRTLLTEKESEEDKKDFDENYRQTVRAYGYHTNCIKKVFRNNDIKVSRTLIDRFVKRSFLDEYEFSLFKNEFHDVKNAAKIIIRCNIDKISYKEYRKNKKIYVLLSEGQ